MQQKQTIKLNGYLSKLNTTVISNTDSLEKIESNLDVVTQTISKLDTRLSMEKEIYSNQQRDINKCINEIKRHVQENKVIHTQFEDELNKAILNTKQFVMNISKAYNKATSVKCQATNSRINNNDKLLQDHDEEIQKLIKKISVYS
eukprot:1982032-Ditylum_brightwellii.AAC.1